jgi:hypothetical protein
MDNWKQCEDKDCQGHQHWTLEVPDRSKTNKE